MNKPRLIDIRELQGCAIIRPMTHEDMIHINSCSCRVSHDEIPTAYDIDKVVERLEEERDRPFTDCNLTINGRPANDREIVACKVGIKYAIEIVKGGAV